jgi:hypothetical protein
MQSEAEFLRLQAERAKARFKQTTRTMVDELLSPLQVRPLIQRRPWQSLGSAAAVGFLSGLGLGRRRPKAAPGRPPGRVRQAVAHLGRRVRRMLMSGLGTMLVANLRSGPQPLHNGAGARQKPANVP